MSEKLELKRKCLSTIATNNSELTNAGQKRIYGRKQFTTHRHNQWFVVDMIDHKGLHYIATYTLVYGTGPQPGFIQLTDLKMQQKPYLIYYTAHAMNRYVERSLEVTHQPRIGNTLFEHFIMYNELTLYIEKESKNPMDTGTDFFSVSYDGIGVVSIEQTERLATMITFLGKDDLTIKKHHIQEKGLKMAMAHFDLILNQQAGRKTSIELVNQLMTHYGLDDDF